MCEYTVMDTADPRRMFLLPIRGAGDWLFAGFLSLAALPPVLRLLGGQLSCPLRISNGCFKKNLRVGGLLAALGGTCVMQLSLRQLSYLVAVIDAGSLTRAADRLNVTPTSLSLQIKHLEEMVGSRLLLRHSRGVSATEAGSIFCDHAREILGRVSELERFILGGGIAAPRSLRVGAVPAVTRMLGIEVIAAAAQTLKGTTLQLSEGWSGDLLEKLAGGALDFVIAYDLDPYDDIEVVTFFEDEFVFICHPDHHPGPAEIDLADALASDLVFYGQSSVSWRAVTEVAARRNLPLALAHREVIHRRLARAVVSGPRHVGRPLRFRPRRGFARRAWRQAAIGQPDPASARDGGAARNPRHGAQDRLRRSGVRPDGRDPAPSSACRRCRHTSDSGPA